MSFQSTKTFGHDIGISACFRQWRSTHSHCQYLHGYALAFRFVFEADTLDDKNWVVDFGGMKKLRQSLEQAFDHKLVIAEDDPHAHLFKKLQECGLCQITVLTAVGCEKFAEFAWHLAAQMLKEQGLDWRVRVVSVECKEHGANSAIYVA